MQRETTLAAIAGVAVGAGLGAGLMYLLDPDRGRRRRSIARDRLAHSAHEATDALRATGVDLRNRSKGLIHEVGRKLSRRRVDDETLTATVRAELGHVAADAGSIVVDSDAGRVSLGGLVAAGEIDRVVKAVAKVPGVRHVRNLLHAVEASEDAPAVG